ncbi:SpoIVD-associated factor A [Caloramator mitchellensis]|uniref:SpoIVD-associated factor A n=1 Tax=Caloramator mitchellensis TaxID=908809 RepID=A0A0R3K2Y8_CALMK|nr:SPOCS domain-containing protein [Caloramator mitchellensis]KRQ87780.1 SpoIVD-associated factor A [Caloramator mitchellensis]
MSIEYVKDLINYEELCGEGQTQTMVPADLVLSERDPDVYKVLSCDGDVYILSKEVVEERIIVEGKVVFKVYYTANDENKRIYKAEVTSSFTHNIQVPGAIHDMGCNVKAKIEHMEYQISTNKKIKLSAVINLEGVVTNKKTVETIVDIKGQDVQILKDSCSMDEYVAEAAEQTVVKAQIDTVQDKEIAGIIKSYVFVYKKDVQVLDGKVLLNATARARVLVEGNNEYFALEQDIPFSSEIEIPEAKPNMKVDVRCNVTDIYTDIVENELGERKALSVQATIEVNVKVYAERHIQSIIDAYSSNSRYEFEKQNVRWIGFYAEAVDNQVLKERLQLPDDSEAIVDVKFVEAVPDVTEVKAVEDKVVCEGVLRCAMIYTKANEEAELEGYEDEIPFKFSVDMPGAKIDMMPRVSVKLESLSFEKFGEREVNIKAGLVCMAKLYKKQMAEILKAVVEIDISETLKNMPSLVIYTVQPHDTLWKIAKKYCTKVEDIVKLNDIDNPDYIEPGMKLIIPKKTFMR